MIERVCSPAVCSYGTRIFVFGGQDGLQVKGHQGISQDMACGGRYSLVFDFLSSHSDQETFYSQPLNRASIESKISDARFSLSTRDLAHRRSIGF